MQESMVAPHTPGRIQKVRPPLGSVIYTVGVLESRIGGSAFWILPGLWANWVVAQDEVFLARVTKLLEELPPDALAGTWRLSHPPGSQAVPSNIFGVSVNWESI